ncbi:MAG TPA: hypothetical protein GXX37_12235 [Clostridiaceae bacterium]|nr:hypothetical protein [Clostridiaceae bacterium]
MGNLKVGFARLVITPPLGIRISGYYRERIADGILDDLEANAIAFSDGENTVVTISLDILHMQQKHMDEIRKKVASDNNIPYEAVFISCTHTHTGPALFYDAPGGIGSAYDKYLMQRISDAAKLAIQDLTPATIGTAATEAKKVGFIRRFRMKSGKIRTNPGVGNPDILAPIGEADESVRLVRIKRENAPEILIVNFQVHPDVIGGCRISADYPRFVRETLEGALPGTKAVYFNGTCGDMNHVNVNANKVDMIGLENQFDDVARGYEHSKHMGRTIAGAVLSVYTKVEEQECDKVCFGQLNLVHPSNRPDPSQIPLAEKYLELHYAGRDDEIPFKGMELTTVVAEAARILRLKDGPDSFTLYLSGVRVGNIAFIGFPGEPFSAVGRMTRARSPFNMTLTCCLTNGAEGYFPTQEAYDEGGYEARSSKFKPGVAEALAEASIELLNKLKNA